jgi:hypothetical protein
MNHRLGTYESYKSHRSHKSQTRPWGTAMKRRSGATLVEVLVAIFVMAIGLMALLALFPLGVLTMSQAIQDERAANAAANATALGVSMAVRQDSAVTPYYLNPNPAQPPGFQTFVNASNSGPSYWVYVDPIGYSNYPPGAYRLFVGGQTNGIPRSTVSYVTTPPVVPWLPPPGQLTSNAAALYYFSLLDDLTFVSDGSISNVTGNGTALQVGVNTIERQNLYSYAYLIRRLQQSNASLAQVFVVVYNQRSLTLDQTAQPDETAFAGCNFDTTRNVVSISWAGGQTPPSVRVGSWILDATPVPSGLPQPQWMQSHAFFYRVVGITQTSDTSLDVEVQTPLLGWTAGSAVNFGTVVFMDGVVEVFDKGTGVRP